MVFTGNPSHGVFGGVRMHLMVFPHVANDDRGLSDTGGRYRLSD